MVLFKIWGERNSGTNFLFKLLNENNFPVINDIVEEIEEKKIKKVKYYKHAIPDITCKNIDNRVIDIFIFRELNSWLLSMYNNPYELNKNNFSNFQEFLTVKQKSVNELLTFEGENASGDDNDKTIFDIRYYKFSKADEYKNIAKDVIFVNLSYLQNEENALIFLQTLDKQFMERSTTDYITNFTHTKVNSDIKNREYQENLDDHQDIIKEMKNTDTENFINELTFSIYGTN